MLNQMLFVMSESLDAIEEAILSKMLDKGIIGMHYKPIKLLENTLKFKELNPRGNFKKILRKLANYGLISDHGKSGEVASLTQDGVKYAESLIE